MKPDLIVSMADAIPKLGPARWVCALALLLLSILAGRAASDTDVEILKAHSVTIESNVITIVAEAKASVITFHSDYKEGYQGSTLFGRPSSQTTLKADKATFIIKQPRQRTLDSAWEGALRAAHDLREGKPVGRIGYYQPEVVIRGNLIVAVSGYGYLYRIPPATSPPSTSTVPSTSSPANAPSSPSPAVGTAAASTSSELQPRLHPDIVAGPITNAANGCIYYLLAANTWKASQGMATLLGGNLATIHDAAENQWILDTFAEYGGQHRALWIGLNDLLETGNYKWVAGELATFQNWANGEPNEIGREHFVYIFPKNRPDQDVQPGGKWNNYQDRATERLVANPICGVVKIRPTAFTPPRALGGMGRGVVFLIVGFWCSLLAVLCLIGFLTYRFATKRRESQ